MQTYPPMIDSPCRKCETRHEKCHAYCKDYEKYKEDIKRHKAHLDEANVIYDSDFNKFRRLNRDK